MTLPPIEALKAQAKRLRESLALSAGPVSHGRALELIAAQYGFRDWNTLCARAVAVAVPSTPIDFRLDERVDGFYLGVPFVGRVAALGRRSGGYLRITIMFDAPVNVSRFEAFSVNRQRVNATISLKTGETPQKTSDGKPQLIVRRIG